MWNEGIKPQIIIFTVYLGNDLLDNYYGFSQTQELLLAQALFGDVESWKLQSSIVNDINLQQDINFWEKINRDLWLWLNNHSKLITIFGLAKKSLPQENVDPFASYYTFEIETYRNNPHKVIKKAIEKTKILFSMFSRFCSDKDVLCLVVGIPSKAMVYQEFSFVSGFSDTFGSKEKALDIIRDKNGYSFKNPSNYYADICNLLNLPYYDLTPILQEHQSEDLYYKVDVHWSSKGQEIAAKAIASYLEKYLINKLSTERP